MRNGKNSEILRTWVEISRKAALANVKTFRGLLSSRTKLFAVVKSNAYGHGLWTFADIVKNDVDAFCVDSAVEGFALRDRGITKPILVLGPTLPGLFKEAAEKNIMISVSNFETLKALSDISGFVAKKATNKNDAAGA